jgi:carboxyl-terminal processing protease
MPRPLRAALILLALLAFLAGGTWLGGHPQHLPESIRGPFVDEQTAFVSEAVNVVQKRYYRKVPRKQLADSAIKGVVDNLHDRFSAYFTPREYKRFREIQDSSFSGVGISVIEDPLGLRVAEVFDKSPAKRAGIERDDIIIAADGRSLKGKTSNQSTGLIRGRSGTEVSLRIRRSKKKVLTKKVMRATVSVPVVASRLKTVGGKKLGVVRLAQFSSGAHAEVYAALQRLLKKGAKGFVFDLRDNGGGLVDEAQLITSAFLTDGPIVTTRGRSVRERTLNATGEPIVPKAPVVVLVNRSTASASEIVAGALQDRKRATIVGTKTFGKGVFQQVLELSNGGALDITAGQYFTPSGRNLGGKGVKTGAGIEPEVRAADKRKTRRDEALDVALRELVRRGS